MGVLSSIAQGAVVDDVLSRIDAKLSNLDLGDPADIDVISTLHDLRDEVLEIKRSVDSGYY